jgi:mRNA-degrading endonuclease RelE of RelBE toxin-antitoxin system
MYEVKVKKKVEKNLRSLPMAIQEKFRYLVEDLKTSGPVQTS